MMSRPDTLNQYLKPLDIDPITLSKLAIGFSTTFKDLASFSDNQFLPTPVVASTLSTENFNGLILAIDVGGSHLRVGLFHGQKGVPLDRVAGGEVEIIPEEVKAGTAEGLFSYIGEQIVHVLRQYHKQVKRDAAANVKDALPQKPFGDELSVGVTFSFPMMYDQYHELKDSG